MKTNRIKLLATMITLATVTIISTIPSEAQRRHSNNKRTETRVQKGNERRGSSSTQNSPGKSTRQKAVYRKSVSQNASNKSATIGRSNRNASGSSQQPAISRGNNYSPKRSAASSYNNTQQHSDAGRNVQRSSGRDNTVSRQVGRNRTSSVNAGRNNNSPISRERGAAYNPRAKANSRNNYERRSPGNNQSREMYRLDRNDKRYSPNNNYRGSRQVWNGNRRPGNMNYNRSDRGYYRKYDYRNHRHWDRSWEKYRWDFYSWRDYYHGYNPYSYRYHRYYYHHPLYGHVISRFVYNPDIFIHNHNRYFCYDGRFFRYMPGIGYVLVDIPFGTVFDGLPYGYERVYVNGYVYFRVGNLFFETNGLGFRLVHYPERYYAYDDGYTNDGYYF